MAAATGVTAKKEACSVRMKRRCVQILSADNSIVNHLNQLIKISKNYYYKVAADITNEYYCTLMSIQHIRIVDDTGID